MKKPSTACTIITLFNKQTCHNKWATITADFIARVQTQTPTFCAGNNACLNPYWKQCIYWPLGLYYDLFCLNLSPVEQGSTCVCRRTGCVVYFWEVLWSKAWKPWVLCGFRQQDDVSVFCHSCLGCFSVIFFFKHYVSRFLFLMILGGSLRSFCLENLKIRGFLHGWFFITEVTRHGKHGFTEQSAAIEK